MQAPYFKVYISKSGRDISGYIEDLKFEDCIKEDDLVSLTVNRDYALRMADDEDFVTGTIISFQFGYLGGATSPVHSARMTNIEYDYAEKVSMVVKCLDLGTVAKKVGTQKIWKNLTASEIAQSIADKYGMEADIQPTTKVYAELPQGNRSDWDFLRYLTTLQDGGNFITYIRSNTLAFKKRALDEHSIITYTYNFGKGPVLAFKPKTKESKGTGAAGAATVNSTTTVKPENEAKGGTTGVYRKYYGESGAYAGKIKKPKTEPVEVQKHIVDPTTDPAEAENIANSAKKKATLGSEEADLELEGNPLLRPDAILTMKNVAKRHEGNWYIDKITHQINNSGYKTTASLNKNGGKKVGTTTKADDANNTVGDDKAKKKVKVRVYAGEDGKYLGKTTAPRGQGGSW